MGAAEDLIVHFDPVAHDSTFAVFADWREHTHGAFKAIKSVSLAFHDHLKRFVVAISTFVTNMFLFHVNLLYLRIEQVACQTYIYPDANTR